MIVSLTKKRGMKIKITDLIRSQKSNIRLRFPKDGISAKKNGLSSKREKIIFVFCFLFGRTISSFVKHFKTSLNILKVEAS
jgi:hypothetical protein